MAGEAFMPMTYGGGIRNLEQIRKIIRCGIETVSYTHLDVYKRQVHNWFVAPVVP